MILYHLEHQSCASVKKMKNNKPYLSIIIPVYNEQKRLKNLETIFAYLKKQSFTSEIIVVNDGSNDKTRTILKKLSQQYPITIVSYKENAGKGFAIKKGMLQANGLYRLFTDIDLATPIETIDTFMKYLHKFPVVIGTRKHKKAKIITHQPKLREFMGKTYTTITNILLELQISDFTCGFKCFSEKAAEEIFSKVTTKRWSFDAEVIYLASRYQYTIREIPLRWSHEPNTKVRLPHDVIFSFLELIKIKINIIHGRY